MHNLYKEESTFASAWMETVCIIKKAPKEINETS